MQEEKIVSQAAKIAELSQEMEKLRKLISQLINGNRSEKRVFSDTNQTLLPFESQEELAAAQAEAEAEAEAIIQEYMVKRKSARRSLVTNRFRRTCRVWKRPSTFPAT